MSIVLFSRIWEENCTSRMKIKRIVRCLTRYTKKCCCVAHGKNFTGTKFFECRTAIPRTFDSLIDIASSVIIITIVAVPIICISYTNATGIRDIVIRLNNQTLRPRSRL